MYKNIIHATRCKRLHTGNASFYAKIEQHIEK